MAGKIAYLIDSAASYNEDTANDIYMVPLAIIDTTQNPEKVYRAGIDLDLKGLAQKISQGSKFKTGATNLGEVTEKVEELIKKYDHVIGIPMDSVMSGTYSMWKTLETHYGSDKFHVINCFDVEYSIIWTLNDIKVFIEKNGFDIVKIDEYVKSINLKKGGTIIVNDVSQLISGGRLRGFKAMMVKALKLRILIKLLPADGVLEYFDKKRDLTDGQKRLAQFLDEKIQWSKNGIKRALLISALTDPTENQKVIKDFQKILPAGTKIDLRPMSSVIAVHTGLNTYSLYLEAN
ncbi:DegV family protein [[Mycoplasma] testudinis]|uniref:DegV family protein n=1 Tax=[Mycoplasma] testudinis TaxID=33924 RepID=UPI0006984A87|nr:DegV family protein [[Mycoplasma] testudinis]